MFWEIGVTLHFYITNCQIFNGKVYKNYKKSNHSILFFGVSKVITYNSDFKTINLNSEICIQNAERIQSIYGQSIQIIRECFDPPYNIQHAELAGIPAEGVDLRRRST